MEFEVTLPFYRIKLTEMIEKIDLAEKESDQPSCVTIGFLRKHLRTQAWAPLQDTSSVLYKLLTSEAFQHTSGREGYIDVEALKIFSLLHCVGNAEERAHEFYCILQEGGPERHEEISAGDKDFERVFLKLCQFVTKDTFRFVQDYYSLKIIDQVDEQIQTILKEENLMEIREDQWLDAVFG